MRMKKLLTFALAISFAASLIAPHTALARCVCTGGTCPSSGYTTTSDACTQADCGVVCRSSCGGDASVQDFSAPASCAPTNPQGGAAATDNTKGLRGATAIFGEAGKRAGFTEDNPLPPEVVVGQIIKTIILLVGVIFGVLVVYAGYLWMVARGNDEYVKKAKQILENATIGLVIVVGAYAITTFVVERIITAAYK